MMLTPVPSPSPAPAPAPVRSAPVVQYPPAAAAGGYEVGKLYCYGIPQDGRVTREQLQAYFSQWGALSDVFLPMHPNGGPRGTAFVTFQDPSVLETVLAGGKSYDIGGGAVINVDRCKIRGPPTGKGKGKGKGK